MAPAEVAVRSGLPARKRRNWRRAIVLTCEISGTSDVIRVMRTSLVMPTDRHSRGHHPLGLAIRSVSWSLQRLQVGDDVLPIRGIGNADHHLGPMYVSRGIGEKFVELLLVPCDARGFKGG